MSKPSLPRGAFNSFDRVHAIITFPLTSCSYLYSKITIMYAERKSQMSPKKVTITYKILAWFVRLFTPKMKTIGAENLADAPVLIVGNHCQMYGPIACEFYLPVDRYTWCAGQMMKLKEVPEYAFRDFWSFKPKHIQWFFRLASYLIAPVSVCIFNNANTIPVYRDTRIVSTFKETIRKLQDGTSVVVFPEHNVKHNHIIYDFEDKFIDIAKLYYKKTEKALNFVPLYIAPKLKQMHLCKPIQFDPDAPIEEERKRICTYLMHTITDTARALPKHTVIPYRNIPKKDYPTNTQNEVTASEKAGR